jgi:FkbM family methyltransferase
MLGGRPAGVIVRNALRPANYAALTNMPRRYVDLRESASRYFRRTGHYPYSCRLRTPAGVVAPTLWSWHDMLTVNEVFCRGDYAVSDSVRVVVDIGSNIGISALYFLTESPVARCYLYEPVPTNVERLRANLSQYADRFEIEEIAVADTEGTLSFGVEPAGRYGGLDRTGGERIDVSVRHIDAVLEQVLAREPFVDVLKLDTEGAEARTLAALSPDLLSRVGTVYLETEDPGGLSVPGFEPRLRCETLRLRNRTPRPAR